MVNNEDGTFSYDANGAFEDLAAGETAEDTFGYIVTDNNGVGVSATVTVTITGANDDPIAADITGGVTENGGIIVLNADFSDVDASDTHTITLDTTATLGQATNNNDGTFNYRTQGAFDYLAAGETAQDTFTYTVDDGHGGTSTATATVTITGTNDAPVVLAVTGAANENGAAIQIAADFTDVDPSNTHTFAVDTAGTLGSVTNNNNGTFSYNPNGAFENLAVGETATDTFTYSVTDSSGSTRTATATVTITGQNDAPVAADVTGAAGENGAAATVNASFTDVDGTDTHTFSINTTGTLGSVTNNNDGTFSYSANGAFESLGAGETAEGHLHLYRQ